MKTRHVLAVVLVILLLLTGLAAATGVDEVRSGLVVELKANQTVTVRCLAFDEILINPGGDSVDVTCRVWLDAE